MIQASRIILRGLFSFIYIFCQTPWLKVVHTIGFISPPTNKVVHSWVTAIQCVNNLHQCVLPITNPPPMSTVSLRGLLNGNEIELPKAKLEIQTTQSEKNLFQTLRINGASLNANHTKEKTSRAHMIYSFLY